MADEPESPEGTLIPDAPLSHADVDRFDYSEIAANLVGAIERAPVPFTIGLYGQWGVGKSTICRIASKTLEDGKEFKVFYFDTWKYERDSFRRQFLIELDKDLFKGKLGYKEKLNQSLTIPYLPPFWEALSKSFQFTGRQILTQLLVPFVLLVIAFGLVLGINSLVYPFINSSLTDLLKLIFQTFTALGFALYIGKFIFESVQVFGGEVEIPRTDSAEGFEHYFKEVLIEFKSQYGNKKLLIVIDNLDRLDHESAVEHLSDIKTFLANEKIDEIPNKSVFLIPCDNEALSTQLRQANKDLNTEEYLRKFFNLSFKIPRLLQLELDDYVSEQLKRTGIKVFYEDNYSLAFVISRAFRNNPREVIQFVNSLTTVFLLAKKRGLSVADKDKIPSLAKVLAVRVKWPEIYSEVENVAIRSAKNLYEALEEVKSTADDDLTNKAIGECEEFLQATRVIGEEEGEIFFSLKESRGQRAVPEWNAFILAAENRDEKTIKEIYEKVEKESRLQALNSLLGSYVLKNKDKETKIFNVFLSVLGLINASNLKTFSSYLSNSFDHITGGTIAGYEFSFDFILNEGFPSLEANLKKKFLSKIVQVLDAESRSQKNNRDDVGVELDQWDEVDSNKELFKPSEGELIKIKGQYLDQIRVGTIFDPAASSKEEYPSFAERLMEFACLKYPVSKDLFPSLARFSKSVLEQTALQTGGKFTELVDMLARSLNETPPSIHKDDDPVKILTSQLLSLVHTGEIELKTAILKALVPLMSPNNPQNNEIVERLAEFVEQRPYGEEDRVLEVFGKEKLNKLIVENIRMRDALVRRTSRWPQLFLTLGLGPGLLSSPQWTQILNGLISQNAVGFNELTKAIGYNLPDEIKADVSINVIRNLSHTDPKIASGLLTFLTRTGLFSAQIPELIQALRNVKAQTDEHEKAVKAFVKKVKKDLGDAQAQEFLDGDK